MSRFVRTLVGGLDRRVLLAALVLAAAVPGPAAAQVTRADSAAVLLDAATALAADGQADAAEALHRWIVRHFPGTAAALEAAATRGGGVRASDGATELVVWGTLYGAWLGVAVPGAFGADGPEAYGAGLLVGAPLGFLASRAVARRGMTIGQARAVTLGGSWGTWQGYGWGEVLDVGEGYVCEGDLCDSGGDAEETLAAMVVGGLAGVAVGAWLGRRSVSDAAATGANLGALWGSWIGVGLGVLTDLEDDDLLAATLVGGDAGLVAGALLTPALGWSRNRWRLVSAAGLLGGVAGAGLDLLFQVESEKTAVATPLVTSMLGLALGAALTGDREGADEGPRGPADALLSRSPEGWVWGTPLPTPRVLPVERGTGVRWRTTLGLTLLRASF